MHEEKIVNRVLKEAGVNVGIEKQAKMFDIDDLVVMVDQVQGLNKGSIYRVIDNNPKPGYITIASFDPSEPERKTLTPIGEFTVDRFVKWNNQY